MKTQTINTNEMTPQRFSGRTANQTTHNLISAARLSTDATTHDHKEVTMKTQANKHTDRIGISSAKSISTSRAVSMRHFNTMLAVALFTLLFVAICTAQQASTMAVPNLIRYSGTLKDAQGAASAPSSTVGVTFAIYKQQDGGAAVWQETQNVALAAGGQYSVILGSTTARGLPDDLFSQQEERWLGVQVQGQAEEARVLLVSVPYAFKAHEAETLGGLPASAFVKAPSSDANNGTSVNALATNGITATGAASAGTASQQLSTCTGCAAGNIPVFTDSTGDLASSLMSQAVSGASAVNDSGSFNLSNSATGFYQIAGVNVLGTGNSPLTTSNIFVGPFAGYYNYVYSTGANNTYVGNATGLNAEGSNNTYMGFSAGWSGSTASTGSRNTFVGEYAGAATTSGNENSAFGYLAGISNTTGSYNLDLANPGVAGESNTIRIGILGIQSKTFIAGIVNNTTTNPANVYISPSGQLEVGTSGVTGGCSNGKIAMWTGTSTLGCSLLSQVGTTVTMAGSITATSNVQVNGNLNVNGTVTGSIVKANSAFQAPAGTGMSVAVNLTDAWGSPCTMWFSGGILVGSSC